MRQNNSNRLLAPRMRRVIVAVDLAGVPREDIDAFLDALEPEPLDEEQLRRILSKIPARQPSPGLQGERLRRGAGSTGRRCRLDCEQLEDRIPPSLFTPVGGEAGDFSMVTVRLLSDRQVVCTAGLDELAGARQGRCFLISVAESDSTTTAATLHSLFAQPDYQSGAGFEVPGTPGEDFQDVLAWNLASEVLALQLAS